MKKLLESITLAAFACALLAGCSGMRIVDSDVTAFPAWTAAPPGPGTAYRFERLPSQQQVDMGQDQIEAITKNSLARVGMVLDPAAARYSVQVVVNMQVVQRYPGNGIGFGGPGVFLGGGSRGSAVGLSFPIGFGDASYQREARIQMRDLSSQKVVFETRAINDGPWNDTLALLPAMLDAALLGFPQPPAGTRRVNVEIPR
jgi:Domain of unknown function (DUF4136)